MEICVSLTFIVLFILKHLVCDFLLQGPYQFLNKGKFGHPGGVLHAIINGIGTMIVIAIAMPDLSFTIILSGGLIDYMSHYFIDYLKVQVNEKKGWKAESSKEYWYSLGIDQTLHWIIYVLILYTVITKTAVIASLVLLGMGVISLIWHLVTVPGKCDNKTGLK